LLERTVEHEVNAIGIYVHKVGVTVLKHFRINQKRDNREM
jgi:hypothetical protein